jgi:3-hydroxymyristoyl/3-hydroxydecanoyl-(acyl carrier protein) dehydratase
LSFSQLRVPHQIPFRAASAARRVDSETIEGTFLCSVNDALAGGIPPTVMVLEAMAQLAGSLVFSDPAQPGFLTAIDGASIDSPIEAGDIALLSVHLDTEFGAMFRFTGTISVDGTERGRAKFYLSAGRESSPPERQ